jgi:hypothetical protein
MGTGVEVGDKKCSGPLVSLPSPCCKSLPSVSPALGQSRKESAVSNGALIHVGKVCHACLQLRDCPVGYCAQLGTGWFSDGNNELPTLWYLVS